MIRIGVGCILAGVDVLLVLQNGIFGGVGYIAVLPSCLPAPRSVVVDLSLALLALLGGDEDDTVGGTCTVDSARSGILEHFDTLDVVGVHKVKTSLDGHAIDDVERIGVVDGTGTTDTNTRSFTRLTRVGGDVDTGCETLQCIVHADGGLVQKVIAADLGDGCRYDALLLHTVTNDHNVLKELVVLDQNDVHLGTSSLLLGDVAHEREHEGGITWNIGNREVAVKIGHRTRRGAFHHDAGTEDGFAHLIYNDAVHHHLLGPCPPWCEQE